MSNKRKQLSKMIRFEVFKRDYFTCQYCSRKSPEVLLEIDHIVPVSENGTNEIDNLLTACFDCNRGKSNKSLNSISPSLEEKVFMMREKKIQYDQFIKLQESLLNQNENLIDMVEKVYTSCYKKYEFNERFRLSVKKFIKKLGVDEVIEAMEISCSKKGLNQNSTLTYFCGICWTKIKEN